MNNQGHTTCINRQCGNLDLTLDLCKLGKGLMHKVFLSRTAGIKWSSYYLHEHQTNAYRVWLEEVGNLLLNLLQVSAILQQTRHFVPATI